MKVRTRKRRKIIVVRRTTLMAVPISVKFVVRATCHTRLFILTEGKNTELVAVAGGEGAALKKTQLRWMLKDKSTTHWI